MSLPILRNRAAPIRERPVGELPAVPNSPFGAASERRKGLYVMHRLGLYSLAAD